MNGGGAVYVGEIQKVAPEYSSEIVLLGKSSNPLDSELKEAILRIQPDRTQLSVESIINLEGQLHVLRKTDKGLERMTSDQVNYMRQRPLVVGDPSTGQTTINTETQLYRDKDEGFKGRNHFKKNN